MSMTATAQARTMLNNGLEKRMRLLPRRFKLTSRRERERSPASLSRAQKIGSEVCVAPAAHQADSRTGAKEWRGKGVRPTRRNASEVSRVASSLSRAKPDCGSRASHVFMHV